MESEKELLALLDELHSFERQFGLGSRFNLFEAINMVRQEIRHSRFLAFLLNPSESHGLADRFLRALLMAAAANHPSRPVSRLALAVTDCSGAFVYCERDHFDITIQIPELRLMFVIENKIDAGERHEQLLEYRQHVENRYSGYKFMGCFLTRDGYAGEDDQWGSLSYSTVANELKRIAAEAIPAPAVALTISHYLELIERRIVVSDELIEACRRIYAQHRVALDLIEEHGKVSVLTEAFENFCSRQPGLEAFIARSNDIYFIASTWKHVEGFQVADKARWGVSCPVKFWFRMRPGKLFLRLEVGPVSNGSGFDRLAYVQDLRMRLKGKERHATGDLFTRVRTHTHAVSEDPDLEEIVRAMGELWNTIGGAATAKAVEDAAKRAPVPSP